MKLRIFAFAALAVLSITACKKSSKADDDTSETTITEQLTQHSDDQNRVSNDMEAVDDDINAAIEANPAFGRVATTGRTLTNPPCDAVISFDTTATSRVLHIHFTGAACDTFRTRTGDIYVIQSRGQHWGQAGSTLRDSIVNLKITRRSDSRSITINGNRTHTNVSGGRLAGMPVGSTIVHTVDATMSITFDDNSQRLWNAARKRTFTHPSQMVFNVAVTGNHSDGGFSDISEWGANRFGNAFRTRITQPLQFRGECHMRLGAGRVVHTGLAHNLEVTYGLDSQGQPTGCPGNNPYFFKAVWTGANGNSVTAIRPYF